VRCLGGDSTTRQRRPYKLNSEPGTSSSALVKIVRWLRPLGYLSSIGKSISPHRCTVRCAACSQAHSGIADCEGERPKALSMLAANPTA